MHRKEGETWQCPRCRRTFANKNQSHYCSDPQKSIDAYIASRDPAIRGYLDQIRTTLQETLPEAVETIAWSMPTYRQGKNIIHFAAYKKHIGLYPGAEAVAVFAPQLEKNGLSFKKGSIQIPYGDSLHLDLVKDIAVWCDRRNREKSNENL